MSTVITVVRLGADPRRPRQAAAFRDPTGGNDFGNEVVAQQAAQSRLAAGEYNFDSAADRLKVAAGPTEERRNEKLEVRVPLSFIHQTASRMEYKESLLRELIMFIPFFIVFLFLLVVSSNVESNYFVSWSVAGRLYDKAIPPIDTVQGPNFGRTFGSLLSPSDWNRWATGSVLDHHFERDNASEAQVVGSNFLGGPNIQIGAIRFRNLRVTNSSCSLNGRWLPTNSSLFIQDCYAPYPNTVDTSAFGPPSAPTLFPYKDGCYYGYIVGDMATYDCSGNYYDVPLNLSRNDAATALSLLAPTDGFDGFFDPLSTRLLSFAFFTYNPSSDYFALTTLWQEYSATGTFVPGKRTIPFRVYSSQTSGLMALTIVFAVMVLLHLIGYFASIVDAARRGKLLERVLNVWMLLDVANIVSFAVLFGFRFTWWKKSNALNYKFSTADGYNESLEYISTLYDAQSFSSLISTLLVFLRLLKFNMLSSRLGVINRTLEEAAQNLLNLLVIFLMIVLSYAVMATALFGSALKDFYSYEVAISSLLRMLIGDFDYDGLKQEQWYLAALFFWSYIILGLFLLLNMMIAVIGDAFEHEQLAAAGAPISDEIAEFMKSTGRTILRFFANPKGAVSDAFKYSKEKFAQRGKYATISEQTRAFRFALPCEHVTADQFALLSDTEKESVLPNPKINRYDLEKVFDADDSSREMKLFLGDAFLDDFWLEVIAEYRFFRDEHVHQKVAKRKARIKVASSHALRAILSESTNGFDCRASEVFALPQESLATLQSIATSLDKIETSARIMGETAARVNAAQLKVSYGLERSASSPVVRPGKSLTSNDLAVANYRRFLRTTTAKVPDV